MVPEIGNVPETSGVAHVAPLVVSKISFHETRNLAGSWWVEPLISKLTVVPAFTGLGDAEIAACGRRLETVGYRTNSANGVLIAENHSPSPVAGQLPSLCCRARRCAEYSLYQSWVPTCLTS